jgi:1-acyl-sn-glycerol-3-phosphate acyltransferase
VLFTSNHPNSLTDSFVIGATVPRKVNFVATVQLFRFAPLKWFLTRCGVIPINRVKDDARAMRTVADTFEACFKVLEAGEAVGIFPEGITYDDAQLKEVKTGAARMALELEHRHEGKLGLVIVPVGLTYSAKENYRSEALVNFGEPIKVADFLAGYAERRKECIKALTSVLERSLQALILHLPELDQARLVEGVKRLYLERLRLGNSIIDKPASPRAEELVLGQTIARAVQHFTQAHPAEGESFARRLATYERRVAWLRVPEEWLVRAGKGTLWWRALALAVLAIIGFPVALYGWVHRLLPYLIISRAVDKFTEPEKKKAQASTTAIVAGVVVFGAFYLGYILIFHALFGWPYSLYYALSLPVTSLVAHYYLAKMKLFGQALRMCGILFRAPKAARHCLSGDRNSSMRSNELGQS